MFAVVALGYAAELSEAVWHDSALAAKCRSLAAAVDAGIRKHAVVNHAQFGSVYAYEVDGLGGSLLMDDANVPSLLSAPYLGYAYDKEIYANTKRFILSKSNPTYHESSDGSITGTKTFLVFFPHHFVDLYIYYIFLSLFYTMLFFGGEGDAFGISFKEFLLHRPTLFYILFWG